MHFLVTFDHTNRGEKDLELYLAGKCWSWSLLILSSPLYNWENKVGVFTRFMVLKMTGLSSEFQCKNWFWKICNGYRDICQNVSKYASFVWQHGYWHILVNILVPAAYFSKTIFALETWAQASCFEHHEPHERNKFFFIYKGGCQYQRGPEQNIRLELTASLLAGIVAGFPQILPGPGQPSENRDLTAPCF